jgi:hypothetical protein
MARYRIDKKYFDIASTEKSPMSTGSGLRHLKPDAGHVSTLRVPTGWQDQQDKAAVPDKSHPSHRAPATAEAACWRSHPERRH